MLLTEHNKGQMSCLVLLGGSCVTVGISPSAEGPIGAEITSMRVPFLIVLHFD